MNPEARFPPQPSLSSAPQQLRRLLPGLALAFILWGACSPKSKPIPSGASWNQNENAIWLSRWWIREAPNEEKLSANKLKGDLEGFHRRGISFLFPHCAPMDRQGNLPPVSKESIGRLLQAASKYEDFFKILPWVGGSTLKTVRLSDSDQRRRWVEQVAKLVTEHGFAGVNVNIEPLEHQDRQIIEWVKDLRDALGSGKLISFCGMRPERSLSEGDEWRGRWTSEDYAALAPHVDQIVVMSYDSDRKTPEAFVAWSSARFQEVHETIEKTTGGRCRFLWGIPTYEDRFALHDPKAETMLSGIQGIIEGLNRVRNASCFQGIAIYANWTTEVEEWEIYDRLWLGYSGESIPRAPSEPAPDV